MSSSIVLAKAIKFALRVVKVYKYLTEEKREFILSKQLLISATFIAKHAKSALHSRTGGFAPEMYVAMQRGLDTELWLLLLHEGEFLSDNQYESLNEDCVELIKLTSSISKTSSETE